MKIALMMENSQASKNAIIYNITNLAPSPMKRDFPFLTSACATKMTIT